MNNEPLGSIEKQQAAEIARLESALAELVAKWTERAVKKHPPSPFHEFSDGQKDAFETCADELTAVLARIDAKEGK